MLGQVHTPGGGALDSRSCHTYTVSAYRFHQLRLKIQVLTLKSFVVCTAHRTDNVPLSCFNNRSPSNDIFKNIPIFVLADFNICNTPQPDEKEAKVLHDSCDSFNLT